MVEERLNMWRKNGRRIGLALGLIMALGATGCARNYVMTLSNGSRTMSRGKPKLEQGVYKFKDVAGQEHMVSAGRVREIAPASMAKKESTRFNPSTGK